MRHSRFTDEQIIGILKEQESGMRTADVCRKGIVMKLKKLRRLYQEEKLTVRKRGGRKRALGTRRPLALPSRPNERWSLDFVSDAFTDGRRFQVDGLRGNSMLSSPGEKSRE